MSLGNVIAIHRREAGLTQERLAEIVGVSHSAIAQIESGKTALPKTKTLQAIAETLQISVTLLLREAGIIPSQEDMGKDIDDLVAAVPEFAELFESARKINRRDPAQLRELVRFAQWLLESKGDGSDAAR